MIGGLFEATQPGAALVTKVLIHSLWQGGIIALLLAAGLFILRKSSPNLRYGLSCLALASVLAWCLVTGIFLGLEAGPSTAGASGLEAALETPADETIMASAVNASENPSAFHVFSGIGAFNHWLFPIWLIGVLMLSVWHTGGWIRARRLVRGETKKVPAEWKERFENMCRGLKVSRPVRLVSASRAAIPCVLGFVKPVVMIPATMFSGMSQSEIEMIIIHELAHVRRHDIILNIIQTIVETLLFFNPAVWWISRQIRIEREHCCDDIVVKTCGDKVGYARALTNLEEMRGQRYGLAVCADGSPLMQRVRRIVGLNLDGSRPAGLGLAGIFAVVTVLGVSLPLFGSRASAETDRTEIFQKAESYEPQRGDIDGEWDIETQRRWAQIRLYFGWNGRSGFSVDLRELTDVIDESTKYFKLVRDAGTFHFEGGFEQIDGDYYGEGRCFFRANQEYVNAMEKLGYRMNDDEVLILAIHDVTLDFARGLHNLGYDNMSLDRLIEAHIHDVSPEYVRQIADLGYDRVRMSKLIEMRIHDVDPEYVREMSEMGYRDLSTSRLVEFKIHDVDAEFVREMTAAGYKRISPSSLVEMKIHDVDPEFVEKLAELGYDDIPHSQLIELKIHDVDPELIKTLADRKYADLDLSELVAMSIHDVTPEYISELAELGYTDIRSSRLVEMKIHDVTPRYIKALAALGYENIDPSRLIEMKIHGVTTSFIERMQARGYDDLSTRDLIDMRIHGRW